MQQDLVKSSGDLSFDTTLEEDDSVVEVKLSQTRSKPEVIEIEDDDEEDAIVVPSIKRAKRQRFTDDSKDILKDVGLSRSNSIFDIVKRISNSPTKKPKGIKVDQDEAVPIPPPFKRSKGIVSDPQKQHQDNEERQSDIPWTEKYAPSTSDELLIHKKKRQDLTEAISNMIYGRSGCRMLVVCGPSGTGKSIASKIIADAIMEEIKRSNKFSNKLSMIESFEVDKSIEVDTQFPNLVQYKTLTTSTSKLTSSVVQFEEFLNGCKLIQDKLIFIEELPNLNHLGTLISFQKSLKEWFDIDRSIKLPPMILCITDFDIENENSGSGNKPVFNIDTNYLCETVLGFKLLTYENKFQGWSRIKFNPVARTFIKKGLQRIVDRERDVFTRITPKSKVDQKLSELSESTGGDFRNSINLLEFYGKFGYHNEELYNGKDTNLNLFHLIGKVIYGTQHPDVEISNFCKLERPQGSGDDENGDLKQHINLIISINLQNEIISQSYKFKNCLFENYNLTNDFTQKVSDDSIIENLSICDGLLNDDISLLISSFSTRINIGSPSSTQNKMKFSRESKVNKRTRETNHEIDMFLKKRGGASVRLSHEEVNLIDGFYLSRIMNSRRMYLKKGKSMVKVKRLGGDFNKLILANFEISNDDIVAGDQGTLKSINDLDYYYQEEGGIDDEEEEREFDLDPLVSESEDNEGDGKGYESFEFSDDDNEFLMNL